MQTQKMSLANIKGKLSRAEMKNIMAGSGNRCRYSSCSVYANGQTYHGQCATAIHSASGGGTSSHCMCNTTYGHYHTSSGAYGCDA